MKLNPITPTTATISETDKEVIVQWQLPPCRDIEVYVDKQTLFLNCRLDYLEESEGTRISYTCLFRQKLFLPAKVNGVQARTSYQNGVLKVIIDKE